VSLLVAEEITILPRAAQRREKRRFAPLDAGRRRRKPPVLPSFGILKNKFGIKTDVPHP
jgi:hypothetical protein